MNLDPMSKVLNNCKLSLKINSFLLEKGHKNLLNIFDFDSVLSPAFATPNFIDKLVSYEEEVKDFYEVEEPVYKMACGNVKLAFQRNAELKAQLINTRSAKKIKAIKDEICDFDAFLASTVIAAAFNKKQENVILDLV